eukprot:Protomagalhaensia_wolfi_Nauph_80__2233@NODE_2451_length_1088_cov_1171_460439_g1509_i1_p3_GENE_NODE_2451_length_1088_cov_1171_460439_g1509_i1NODE_2451_length_1088_cov_1171_460439_g1509_i1_p3_ORF_typecomplete_len120_score16_03DNA_ligase_ZBD/PF03119_16/0_048_NODE_2451_length_1088_cov_1171_460439_g1509_i1133492
MEQPLSLEFRCKECRTKLFTEDDIAEFHEADAGASHRKKGARGKHGDDRWFKSTKCTSLHVNEATWFGLEFQAGNQEGAIYCPNSKCNKKIGRFCWHGLTCSCGLWTAHLLSHECGCRH